MLRVANGCTERQFPLVRRAVLVCSYDVIGTRCCDYRVSVYAFAVQRFVSESSERIPERNAPVPAVRSRMK